MSPVFHISLVVTVLFALWGIFAPESLGRKSGDALEFATRNFGWFFLLAAFLFLVFTVYLFFSDYAHVRLGRDDEVPEYSYRSWLAMLFAAGMGIGLVFFGVAEPMYHFADPPMGLEEAGTPQAARLALRYSFFHWGLHPWAIYSVMALAIAYTHFRRNDSSLISATFRPLLGSRVDGPWGQTIDTLATVATVFGVATSLGLGTLQIAGGMNHLFGIPNATPAWLVIIVVVTALYMTSAITGLNRGILYLSNINMLVAGALLLFVFLVGPTSFILDSYTTVFAEYIGAILPMSFRLTPFTQGTWLGNWTLFYWAWWIAWAPFVGTFIARVSRGRTIREFVSGVVLVPTVLGTFWFAVFGGSALHFDLFKKQEITASVAAGNAETHREAAVALASQGGLAEAVQSDVTTALFLTLEQFPWGTFLGFLAALLIATFFITSADSATFVLGMFTNRGNPNPPVRIKLVWGVVQSTLALSLLLSGGESGLRTMQTAAIVAAFPFTIVMILMVVSLNRALKEDRRHKR
ncbi:MAG TPA: BCCT family transporter [Methylomirabilota bacterium]|nr:BCCT family transporter [Methylomirabilota bacterium]